MQAIDFPRPLQKLDRTVRKSNFRLLANMLQPTSNFDSVPYSH